MQPLPALRENRERVFALLREKENRAERIRQSNPEGGLLEFIRYFWHILEPVDPLVEGWPLECLCAHLEAITRGENIVIAGEERAFNRFLCNVPPGFQKSLCVNVWWPAWEWGPMGRPHLRYVAFSYASELTERDNAKFRDLVCSDAYKELWGHVFKVIGDPKAGKVRITNDKTGFKFASSLLGVGTGERGHRVLCLAGDQKVLTERGAIPIQELVAARSPARVWSLNAKTGSLELKAIEGWHRNPGRPLVRIVTESGASLTCTHDHEVYTDRGCRVAAQLGVGDGLFAAPRWMLGSDAPIAGSQLQIEMTPSAPVANAGNGLVAYAKLDGEHSGCIGVARSDLANQVLSKVCSAIAKGPVRLGVGDVLRPRAIVEIIKAAVARITVEVAHFLVGWARSYKRHSDQLVNEAVVGLAVLSQAHPRVAFVGCRKQDALSNRDSARRPWPTARVGASDTAGTPERGHLVEAFEADRWKPTLDRVASVEPLHEVPSATYCLTVEGNHNMICGADASIITANCDDVHKLKGTTETAEARQAVTQWVREAMQNRLNDLTRDAIVVIMQRVHEEDASGSIMKHLADEYCHLIVPMAFEANRHFSHYKGWNDGEDPRTRDGELAWPERYPPRALMSYKRNDYLWAGQYQQTPIPRGGGIFKDHWWQPYNVPVGGHYEFDDESVISIIASLDTAFKEKEENDYTALTVWAVYDHPKTKQRRVMIIDAWRKRLALHGQYVPRLPEEEPVPGDDAKANNKRELTYLKRAAPKWGLCEWLTYTCSKRKVRRLIIEDSARGHDTAMELQRLFMNDTWTVVLEPVKGGDKWDRAQAVTDVFTDDMVFAPGTWVDGGDGGEQTWMWRDWVQEVILELCSFPRGTHDDYVDSCVQALRYLRRIGLAIRRSERLLLEREMSLYKKPSLPLYPA